MSVPGASSGLSDFDLRWARPRVPAPLLSVVVPVLNLEHWILETLASVQAERTIPIEIIVVDDGSTDLTTTLVSTLAARDPRIRFVKNPGLGGASARNHGARLARGIYLAFADGDDIVPEGAYSRLVTELESSSSDLAVGDYLTFSTTTTTRRNSSLPIYGTHRRGITLEDEPLLLRDRVCWNKVFRLAWWRWHTIEFADSPRSNDIFAMTRAYTFATIDIVPGVNYLYRTRVGNSSMTSKRIDPIPLRQHFLQEVACYRFLAANSAPDVIDAYFLGVMTHAAWSYLDSLANQLRASSMPIEWDPEISELVAQLVDGTPKSVWSTLSKERHWLYRVIASGQLDLVSILPGRGITPSAARNVPIDTWMRLRDVIGDAAGDLFTTILRTTLLPELMATVPGIDDDALTSAAQAPLQFQREFVPRRRLRASELAVIDAAAADDLAIIRGTRLPTYSGSTVLRVTRTLTGAIRLESPNSAGLTGNVDDTGVLIAERKSHSGSSQERRIKPDASRRRARRSPVRFVIRRGFHDEASTWALTHERDRNGVLTRSRVVIDPDGLLPRSRRINRFYLTDDGSTALGLVLNVKPSLWRRIIKRGRRLRPVRQSRSALPA